MKPNFLIKNVVYSRISTTKNIIADFCDSS